jgi:hypothetical protein
MGNMMIKGSHVFRMTAVENNIMHTEIIGGRQGMSSWGSMENGSGHLFFP